MTKYIKIPLQLWKDILYQSESDLGSVNNRVPDVVWDAFFKHLCSLPPTNNNRDPQYLVDNLIYNGDWGPFDKYKETGETDKHFIERVKDRALHIFKKEKIVIFNYGLYED